MEVLHAKQQNILRRKIEDVTAVTKRLKVALSYLTKSNKSSSTSTTSENNQQIKSIGQSTVFSLKLLIIHCIIAWLLGEL